MEGAIVNGSHDPDIEIDLAVEQTEEKVLKPRKPVAVAEEMDEVIQNGSSEVGSVSDESENPGIENGFDTDTRKVSTPAKDGNKEVIKESPSNVETPAKRELRRREPTPLKPSSKPDTPIKRQINRRGTPVKRNSAERIEPLKPPQEEKKQDGKEERKEVNESFEDSVIIIEDSKNESGDHSDVDTQETATEGKGSNLFSVFRRSFRRNSFADAKDICEATTSSSPSIICLDSPSISGISNTEIKGRKAINSFSRFPGRSISITSAEGSLKRKAEESFNGDGEIKRFAGLTESGSEKSPGWHFFSSSWSPVPRSEKTLPETSTPFHKKFEQDSLAVNFNEESKMSFEDTVEVQGTSAPVPQGEERRWCLIM